MAFRTAAARLGQRLAAGVRGMAHETAEARWAPYFPQPKAPSPEAAKKALNRELLGFYLLGPLGAGFMFYDYIIGLEEEHDVTIPPYPWMRWGGAQGEGRCGQRRGAWWDVPPEGRGRGRREGAAGGREGRGRQERLWCWGSAWPGDAADHRQNVPAPRGPTTMA